MEWVLWPAWIGLCAWIAHSVGELFTDNPLRLELKAVLLVALLPLVLMDELIAKAQFDQLCTSRAAFTVHRPTRGRLVYPTELPAEPVPGLMVPVFMHKRVYLDVHRHEPVVSINVIHARGGKLARVLDGPEAEPITFEGRCSVPDWPERLTGLGLRVVRQPPAVDSSVR
ncbi:hypothetical protein JI739_17030 [Ramlibacter sp. AW1]|uniref:Uncharacterized protein n=1 Tax=Ramlibacter aurantiacus TaxID=2801330 RepID=A0A936ZRC0_9BURK|nr:hypothetical protein [Ramlibacter aurantiacus]